MVLDRGKIYFGTDIGEFFCIEQSTGTIVWQKKIWFGKDGKFIFSTPVVHQGLVYFGAYDGNFYCIDQENGRIVWKYSEADWIGSTPTLSIKNSLIYVGLEFGLWK
jgi:outer membrane protein assembly factor BamB